MSAKRFRIAFSFAGEKRDFVAKVAGILAARFTEEKILYDEYHEAEFATYDRGIRLPKLYGEESDLIVPVLCERYDHKRWTGWEWVHIYGLLTKEDGHRVMPSRFDHAIVDGLSPAAAFIELDRKTPAEFAALILERLALNEGRPKSYYAADSTSAAPRVGANISNNLPRLQYFFGREEELAKIAAALAPEARGWGALIDGPGGIGKTALAIRAAELVPHGRFQRIIFLSAKERELTPDGQRALGHFVLPTYIEMLNAIAREIGQPKLTKELETKASASTDLDRRGRLALLALVRAEQGQDDQAKAALAALKPLLEAVSPEDPESERWPELVAVAGVLGRPALRESAKALTDVLVDGQIRKDHKAVGETWKLHASQVAALLGHPDSARPTIGPDLGLLAWSRVTHSRGRSRGTGAPLPLWSLKDQALTHLPGHDRDFVYLRTPLRGDFEVSGEVPGGRPIHLAYGGLAVGLAPDGKEVEVTPIGGPSRRIALDSPIKRDEGKHRVKLTVKDASLLVSLDDRKLFEQGLPARPDPWLALYQPAGETGSIRNLKLEGDPTVPDHLDLSDQPDLLGWLTDVEADSEPNAPSDPAWEKRGDEVFGRLVKDAAGSKQESLLRYHRPMLEDGEVAYEFYYEPGKAAVHPTLDRLTFLVEPGGVELHRLTDGPSDRSGLAPDNALDEPACRRGPGPLPLEVGAWNRMALAVVGDRLALRLNDELVYERPIEPTNQRTFGLFHYADEAEARARNVTYRGAWPKEKPATLGFDPDAKP